MPQKGLALLAYLASTPGVAHSRQKLADFFWPKLAEKASRNNLRQALLGLKRSLGETEPTCLVSTRQEIRYEAIGTCYSDLGDFLTPVSNCSSPKSDAACLACLERMETMSALYRGPFLDNVTLEGSPEFESWLQIQREKLEHQVLYLLEKLSSCHEMQERLDKSLFFAERFAELAPWNDEGIRRVLQLAALKGQRGFALNRYQAYCRTLKEELGVLPEVTTRQLAQSIQNGELKSSVVSVPVTEARSQELPSQDLERRQITICHCRLIPDIEGDPEEEYEQLKEPLERCKEIFRLSGGHVAGSIIGDGLLAFYGFPQAQENSSVLAVRTALSLRNITFTAVSLRIGIHTSLVLSAMDRQNPDVGGRATGRAVGLTALAENGEIVVSEATHERVGGYFECQELGEHALVGRGNTEAYFKVAGATFSDGHLNQLAEATPLIGRGREMTTLKEIWAAVIKGKGKGSAILLQGEPGIGKSRLVSSFKDILPETSCVVLELRCDFELSQSPFKPVINLLKSVLSFIPGDDEPARLSRLAAAIGQWYPDRAGEILTLAEELLSLPISEVRLRSQLSAQQQREQTIVVLLELLGQMAQKKPILVVVEDLHWVDPSTLETLSFLLSSGIPDSVLLIMTARSEFTPPWRTDQAGIIHVSPLPEREIRRIVTTICQEAPPSLLDRIAARADGVPLFAEELSRLPASSPMREECVIPASLQDLLAARLDGLNRDKRLAQLAATIGREFDPQLVAELALHDEKQATEALLRLKQAGLISIISAKRWHFRHALIRDAAYLSQTLADRESAHLRIAQTFAADYPEIATAQPELLAYHWSNAGEVEPAVRSWMSAGSLAQSHNAHHEAVRHFKSGLALVPRLSGVQQGASLEWQLQVGLGASAYAVEGYASPQGAAAYLRAVELSEQKEVTGQSFPALWGLWAGASSHSTWGHSLRLAQRLVRIVQKGKDPLARQQGYFALGNVQFWRGEFVTSRRYLEQAIREYAPTQHNDLVANYGENSFATSNGYLSWGLCLLGFPEQALHAGERAVDEADRSEHPFSRGYALTFFTVLHRILRQPKMTLKLADQTIALANDNDFPLWLAGATLMRGWSKVMVGQPDGLLDMEWGVDQVAPLMSGISLIFLETQIDGLCHAEQPVKALAVIDRAFELIDQRDDHHVEAELYRHKGICLLQLSENNVGAAEDCFRQALQISQKQSALLYELRATMALTRLFQRRDRSSEGAKLLTDTYRRFSEGFSCPDLIAARKLMAEV